MLTPRRMMRWPRRRWLPLSQADHTMFERMGLRAERFGEGCPVGTSGIMSASVISTTRWPRVPARFKWFRNK